MTTDSSTAGPGVGEARLAVLGSPIAHSKSPTMHSAAYAVLGLPWSYERFEMTGDRLPEFLDGLGSEWRGLSLTMPVKRDVLPLLDEPDERVLLTGAANTLLFDGGRRRGFNTDVYGITAAFERAGVVEIDHAQVLGGGATAASAIVAAAHLGARRVTLSVRSPQRSLGLVDLGERLGLRIHIEPLGEHPSERPDAVISTLPNGAEAALHFDDAVRADSVLFDVGYEPWPTALAAHWEEAGGRVISGLEMLVFQALLQVRIFVSGQADDALDGEADVLSAMRSSVALPVP
ncbi:shikimate dehydrogenase [Homoserinimonas aerilata]|uniref:Shikimate dehydrogenase n=1 Tax=Homoserinimonas aerilata TaxID=1162970 RepID=A0A542YIR1_9MICO|nr:shikimate dehydrogenase [Homoserinimonas aerilata]TQL47962.1 shikimate dehydrogenase [Homoserinimonas aerilata]